MKGRILVLYKTEWTGVLGRSAKTPVLRDDRATRKEVEEGDPV